MAARALVVNEGVASIAVSNARENGLGLARLKQLSGVDFAAMLRTSRPLVDADAALHSYPSLQTDLAQAATAASTTRCRNRRLQRCPALLHRVHRPHRRHLASPADQPAAHRHQLLARHGTAGRTHQRAAHRLRRAHHGRAPGSRHQWPAPPAAGDLHSPRTARGRRRVRGQHEGHPGPARAQGPGRLGRDGPRPHRREVLRGHHRRPKIWSSPGRSLPLTTDLVAHARAFSDAQHWLDDIFLVVQGAVRRTSATSPNSEADAAVGSFQLDLAIFLLSVLFAAAAALLLTRSVVRPLRRLSSTARKVAEGDFTLPAVVGSGPREVVDTILGRRRHDGGPGRRRGVHGDAGAGPDGRFARRPACRDAPASPCRPRWTGYASRYARPSASG